MVTPHEIIPQNSRGPSVPSVRPPGLIGFDLLDYLPPAHDCAGKTCTVCEITRNGIEAKEVGTAKVVRDPRWWHEANEFINTLAPGARFTADDLVELIGLPDGSPNQVGACVRTWAAQDRILANGYEVSRRKSNHGRVVRLWRKA